MGQGSGDTATLSLKNTPKIQGFCLILLDFSLLASFSGRKYLVCVAMSLLKHNASGICMLSNMILNFFIT